jgi:hypothetical protein
VKNWFPKPLLFKCNVYRYIEAMMVNTVLNVLNLQKCSFMKDDTNGHGVFFDENKPAGNYRLNLGLPVGLALPGVRLVTWTILGCHINCYFDCEITREVPTLPSGALHHRGQAGGAVGAPGGEDVAECDIGREEVRAQGGAPVVGLYKLNPVDP